MQGLDTLKAIVETIQEVGEAPEGVLFSALQTQGMTLAQFEAIMSALEGARLISRKYHLVRWIGAQQ